MYKSALKLTQVDSYVQEEIYIEWCIYNGYLEWIFFQFLRVLKIPKGESSARTRGVLIVKKNPEQMYAKHISI